MKIRMSVLVLVALLATVATVMSAGQHAIVKILMILGSAVIASLPKKAWGVACVAVYSLCWGFYTIGILV